MHSSQRVVLSLFDHSLFALEPWARNGYECHAYDIQNVDEFKQGIHVHQADLYDTRVLDEIRQQFRGRCVMAIAFPPCTDLSIAGARWWARKAAVNASFQEDAVERIKKVASTFEGLGCPWVIENPRSSRLGQLWRPCNYAFNPCDYGGYLPLDDKHPKYKRIPPRDAYTKKTGLWTSSDFTMPLTKPVEPVWYYFLGKGGVGQRRCTPILGGANNSNLRSATPRGFANALYINHQTGPSALSPPI